MSAEPRLARIDHWLERCRRHATIEVVGLELMHGTPEHQLVESGTRFGRHPVGPRHPKHVLCAAGWAGDSLAMLSQATKTLMLQRPHEVGFARESAVHDLPGYAKGVRDAADTETLGSFPGEQILRGVEDIVSRSSCLRLLHDSVIVQL